MKRMRKEDALRSLVSGNLPEVTLQLELSQRTHIAIAQKTMSRGTNVKIVEMPVARQTIMDNIPNLIYPTLVQLNML